ncbi:thiamin biosynthesis lipoprotein ApbE [Fibrobacteres bacterium R8-0-B4]
MTRIISTSLLILLSLILSILTLSSCTGNDHHVLRKQIFFRMDTMAEITISIPPRYNPAPLWRSIDSLLAQYEKRFSATGDSSEINAVNTRTSNALPVSMLLGDMLRTGIDYGDTLDGAFDITVLPLKELWGFCERCGDSVPIPESSAVSAALQSVNYKKVRINDDGDSLFFESPETRIDVGGIAKGFVIKRLGELMRDRGVDNFLISTGGDIIVYGHRPNGAPWRVGVRHPRNAADLIDAVHADSGAVFTSGDYERFKLTEDGRRYHHIFDPSSGYPCDKNQSLTIRTPDPVRADILSTGLFCRETEAVIDFVNSRADVECLAVDSTGTVFKSSGW